MGDPDVGVRQPLLQPAKIDMLSGDVGVGDAGDLRDHGRDRHAGVAQRLPGIDDADDAAGRIDLDRHYRDVDNLVAPGIGAGGLGVDDARRAERPFSARGEWKLVEAVDAAQDADVRIGNVAVDA